MIYTIGATVTRTTVDGWQSTIAVPTFFLDSTVQGIVSEDHASRIATRMLAEIAGPDAEICAVAVADTRMTDHG